ncbi:M20 aminoacylase family protein [Roseateles sp. BYS180W]|uniref:M20 aminoacylase family protein n=1 Tax=Roseateles rivi TaxID=3299028 RepID=A0ABW7FR74_9BURK
MKLIEPIVREADALAALRRDLHAHPELCYEELRTSELIANTLEQWGIEVHRGLGKTGVVGVVRGHSAPERLLGLRADIDALPMTEVNRFAHASRHAGKMHACGHDGHTAMLLAAAQHLAASRDFAGTVVLVFQPAEEGGGGARAMIEDGLLQRFPVEAMFGIHNWPGLAEGQFAVSPGPVFASSNEFKITVHGKGAHGAMPHLGVDPVLAACHMVLGFQSIVSRNLRPIDTGVISVTMVQAGEATNVIPDHCELQGTVRAFRPEVLDLLESRMRQLADSTATAFGARCDFHFHRNYPPTINHARETAFVQAALSDWLGPQQVLPFEPTMGAEDFSYYLQQVPGCYFLIGNGEGQHRHAGHGLGPCMLHNPSYDFNDALIPLGGSMWVELVQRWFAQPR